MALTCWPGMHSVDVSYDGSPVPKSPFRVPVTEGCDPARVRVHGPGLQSGITNKPNKFTVETRWGSKYSASDHNLKNQVEVDAVSLMTMCFCAVGQVQVDWGWLWRDLLKQKCPALTTKMAAVVSSTSHTSQAHTTSMSPMEVNQSLVSVSAYHAKRLWVASMVWSCAVVRFHRKPILCSCSWYSRCD